MSNRSTNDEAIEIETDAFLEEYDVFREGDFHATESDGGTLHIRDEKSAFVTSYARGSWSAVRPLINKDRPVLLPSVD